MKKLVLASSSPARRQILEAIRFPFIVDVSNFEEDMSLNMAPQELAKYLSQGKAEEVARRHKNTVVLAADSFAVFNGQLLGKPHTIENAKKMLTSLSGGCHSFITGFTILESDTGEKYSDVIETKVCFRKLTSQEIDGYLKKENVLNNAGAYIIQRLGGALVDRIEGDYSNIMGLPLSAITPALKDFGINIL